MITFDDSPVLPGSSPAVQTTNLSTQSPGQLRRILGLWDLVLMIIGTVIGSGIFLAPGAVLRAVGNSVPVGREADTVYDADTLTLTP